MKFQLDSVFGHLSVQGQPLLGLRKFGVPPGGCFQPQILASLNQLLGNFPDALGLELALGRFSFTAQDDLLIAAGPNALLRAGRTRLLSGYANRVPQGTPVSLVAEGGARTFLAFGGGVQERPGSILTTGQAVHIGAPQGKSNPGLLKFEAPAEELLAVPGDPQFSWIFDREFTVSPQSDRVGIRLKGVGQPHALELPSRPATIGTVQVTPPGELIIFGPDGPTIGGYPQAATVVRTSQETLAQLAPGDSIRFRAVSVLEARIACGQIRP